MIICPFVEWLLKFTTNFAAAANRPFKDIFLMYSLHNLKKYTNQSTFPLPWLAVKCCLHFRNFKFVRKIAILSIKVNWKLFVLLNRKPTRAEMWSGEYSCSVSNFLNHSKCMCVCALTYQVAVSIAHNNVILYTKQFLDSIQFSRDYTSCHTHCQLLLRILSHVHYPLQLQQLSECVFARRYTLKTERRWRTGNFK